MSQNISGINITHSVNASQIQELQNFDDAESKSAKVNSQLESTDEDLYQEVDFEDMSLQEVTAAAQSLENELLGLQMQLDILEQTVKSNEEIKANYEKQCEELKEQVKQVQKEICSAETPQEKMQLRKKQSALNKSIQDLSSQITSLLYEIRLNSSTKSALRSEYTETKYDYSRAQIAQGDKQKALDRELKASDKNSTIQLSSSGSTTSINAASANPSAAPSGASSGKSSNNMLNALKGWEGLRTTAYKCAAGVWTIGYGHTGNVSPGQTISEAQAEQYLRQDLSSFENEVTSLAKNVGVKLTQGQYDALVSFSYNCGGGALKKSGILEMLKGGNIDGAASKLKQYVHGGGKVLPGLVSRRETEASWLYT